MYLPALADDTPQTAVTISDDIIAGVLQRIYHNRYGKRGDDGIDTRLYDATREVFNRASAEGIASAVDNNIKMPSDTFLRRMDRNNAVFSAFRTHRMQRDIAAMMYDDKGKVKPFDTFRRDVAPVVGKYRTDWLRTEYTTAVQRSRLAAQWQQYANEADVYPNLEWVPSTSPNPGADHRIFWGVRQPVDSPFWDRHRPGDRWNCQCDLRQSDDEPTDPPMDPIDDNNSPAPGLDNNPGKDAVIFNDSHPYFPKSCAACPFYTRRNLVFPLLAQKKANCYDCINYKDAKAKIKIITNANETDIDYLIKLAKTGRPKKICAEIGTMPNDIINYIKENAKKLCGEEITVTGEKMYISDTQIAHALRSAKGKYGKTISEDDMISIQTNLKSSTVYFDITHKNILFLCEREDERYIKYCFDLNYKLAGMRIIYFITAGIVRSSNIEHEENYINIKIK